jgi:hypothetical protein
MYLSIDLSKVLSTNNTTKQSDQFIKQLRNLVSQQGMSISIIENHDHESIVCSGEIISIQIMCQCSKSSDCTNDRMKQSIKTDSSIDVSFKSI